MVGKIIVNIASLQISQKWSGQLLKCFDVIVRMVVI